MSGDMQTEFEKRLLNELRMLLQMHVSHSRDPLLRETASILLTRLRKNQPLATPPSTPTQG